VGAKTKQPNEKKKVSTDTRCKSDTKKTLIFDIKCFLCLKIDHIASQYPIFLHDHGEIEYEKDNNDDEMPSLEDASDDNVEYLVEDESLMIRLPLSV